MADGQAERRQDVAVKILERLPRQAIHQINAEVTDARPVQRVYGLYGLTGRVAAPNQAEQVVAKRLYTQADAVDRQPGERFGPLLTDVVGVGFEGNFGFGQPAAFVPDDVEHVTYALKRQLRGGSAAPVYGVQRAGRQFAQTGVQLGLQRQQVGLSAVGAGRGGIKGAIGAAAGAEGDV